MTFINLYLFGNIQQVHHLLYVDSIQILYKKSPAAAVHW